MTDRQVQKKTSDENEMLITKAKMNLTGMA